MMNRLTLSQTGLRVEIMRQNQEIKLRVEHKEVEKKPPFQLKSEGYKSMND